MHRGTKSKTWIKKYPKHWNALIMACSTSWNGGLRLSLAKDSSVTEQARRRQ
jgi:hypothetical protein